MDVSWRHKVFAFTTITVRSRDILQALHCSKRDVSPDWLEYAHFQLAGDQCAIYIRPLSPWIRVAYLFY